ncbi:hypothetical protein BOX15_Mlig007037g1, partial [Macrostomum lignano]
SAAYNKKSASFRSDTRFLRMLLTVRWSLRNVASKEAAEQLKQAAALEFRELQIRLPDSELRHLLRVELVRAFSSIALEPALLPLLAAGEHRQPDVVSVRKSWPVWCSLCVEALHELTELSGFSSPLPNICDLLNVIQGIEDIIVTQLRSRWSKLQALEFIGRRSTPATSTAAVTVSESTTASVPPAVAPIMQSSIEAASDRLQVPPMMSSLVRPSSESAASSCQVGFSSSDSGLLNYSTVLKSTQPSGAAPYGHVQQSSPMAIPPLMSMPFSVSTSSNCGSSAQVVFLQPPPQSSPLPTCPVMAACFSGNLGVAPSLPVPPHLNIFPPMDLFAQPLPPLPAKASCPMQIRLSETMSADLASGTSTCKASVINPAIPSSRVTTSTSVVDSGTAAPSINEVTVASAVTTTSSATGSDNLLQAAPNLKYSVNATASSLLSSTGTCSSTTVASSVTAAASSLSSTRCSTPVVTTASKASTSLLDAFRNSASGTAASLFGSFRISTSNSSVPVTSASVKKSIASTSTLGSESTTPTSVKIDATKNKPELIAASDALARKKSYKPMKSASKQKESIVNTQRLAKTASVKSKHKSSTSASTALLKRKYSAHTSVSGTAVHRKSSARTFVSGTSVHRKSSAPTSVSDKSKSKHSSTSDLHQHRKRRNEGSSSQSSSSKINKAVINMATADRNCASSHLNGELLYFDDEIELEEGEIVSD